jgi:site-specific DNA recombinase
MRRSTRRAGLPTVPMGAGRPLPIMISIARDRTADATTPAAQKESCLNSSPSQAKVARPLAAIYVRQSRTDEDAGTHNISPDMQEQACRKLLDGYEVQVFSDLNRSGKETSKRSAYLEMLRLVDDGVITKVVAYELSRITRDVGDQADFFKRLAARGVEFVSAREHIDVSSPEGEFGAVILGGSNQLQRKQIQRRVRDAFERKRERGDSIGRLLPGLVRTEERDAQGRRTTGTAWDPAHVATIRELFAEYATGSHSFRSLAREMSRRGYALPRSVDAPPREAASVQWTPEKVRGLLSNEKYTGEYTHRGHRYQIPVAGIIDAATWSACVRIRMGAHKPLRVNRKNRNYLLSGILHCARCGTSCSGFLHRESGRKSANRTWPYYICATHRNLGREGCAQPYFRQPEIEAATLKFLQALMIPGLAEAVDAAIASYAGQERKSNRQTRRRSIDERLKRLADLFELGDRTKTEYVARRNDLLIERNQLEAQPAAASIALQRQRLESIVDDWSVMTDEEKKRVLQMIFSEIGADHTVDGLKIEFRPRPVWEPYVEAVLARQRQEQDTLVPVTTSERKTGFEPATPSLARTCATAAPLPREPC